MFSDVSDVVEAWIADRKLSRRKLAFLRTVFDQGMESISRGVHPPTAGGIYCEELELPHGSSWLEVVASLLDHLEPRPTCPSRLAEARDELVELTIGGYLQSGETATIAAV